MTLVLLVLFLALAFEFINGFHDTANAIATVVATKVLSPRRAILMAGVTNFLGALCGTEVASTVGSGIVKSEFVSLHTLVACLLAGIIWNLLTWWKGLPSSSSHALIGGLVGATWATSSSIDSIKWGSISEGGLIGKVVVPMCASPIFGFIVSLIVMGQVYGYVARFRPKKISVKFKRLQILSSAWVGFTHGLNDAQKTMGIIALALVIGTREHYLEGLSSTFSFLTVADVNGPLFIPFWVKILCALTICMGTMSGGWRIIRTLGHRLVTLKPINGFAAECSSAIIIQAASTFGIPLSTTHVISSTIVGVGTAKKLSSANWSLVRTMVTAWIFTIPVCGLLAYVIEKVI